MAAVLERQSEASGAQALAQEQAQQGMEDLELAGPIPIQQLQVRPWKQLTNPDPDNWHSPQDKERKGKERKGTNEQYQEASSGYAMH